MGVSRGYVSTTETTWSTLERSYVHNFSTVDYVPNPTFSMECVYRGQALRSRRRRGGRALCVLLCDAGFGQLLHPPSYFSPTFEYHPLVELILLQEYTLIEFLLLRPQ